jgi:large subunit ribosomal protein L9
MAVELILMSNVEDLGRIGDTVRVADGYARNYLVPRGLASKMTAGTRRQLEAKKKRLDEEYARDVEASRELAERIAENSVNIPVQASEDEKLYGSVTAQQIADALQEMELDIHRRQVALAEPIRELGVYPVEIHLHPEVTATVKVWVVKA